MTEIEICFTYGKALMNVLFGHFVEDVSHFFKDILSAGPYVVVVYFAYIFITVLEVPRVGNGHCGLDFVSVFIESKVLNQIVRAERMAYGEEVVVVIPFGDFFYDCVYIVHEVSVAFFW